MASKFKNVITEWNGRRYHSKLEASRAQELERMRDDGEIFDLDYQPKFVFKVHGVPLAYPSGRAITYTADFEYRVRKGGMKTIEDTKGALTGLFRIKWALAKAHFPQHHFLVSRFKSKKWILTNE